MITNLAIFFAGICMASFLASGIFFFKFWKSTRDRFFLLFGSACVLLALERVVALFVQGMMTESILPPDTGESTSYVYAIRLCAFLLIVVAVLDKNRSSV